MDKKIFVLLSGLTLGILNCCFCASAAVMQYVEPAEPLEYRPLYVEDRISFHLFSMLYNNMVGTDVNFQSQPELLENLTLTSPSPGVYRVKLKSDVQWVSYDGLDIVRLKPFTAADIVYTFEQIKEGQNQTSYHHLKDLFENVRQIANDEVEFELKADKSHLDEDFILRSLRFPVIPDPANIDMDSLEHFKGHPVIGTGPFVMIRESFQFITLERNEYYFRHTNIKDKKRAEISSIQMNARTDLLPMFEQLNVTRKRPKLHLMTEIPLERFNEIQNPNITTIQHGTNNFTYIAYNCEGVFKDKRLRQAFTYAFNRKEVFINVYGQIFSDRENKRMEEIKEIVHCPLPPNQTPTNIPILEYNPDKAKRLLKAIMEDEKTRDYVREQIKRGFDLLTYKENPTDDRIFQQFRQQIDDHLGIKIRVTPMTKAEWNDVVGRGEFEIAFGRAVFNRDVNIIKELFGTNSRQNFVSYRNDELDKLINEYDRADNPELRYIIRTEMAEILANDVPYTFLYRIPKYAAYRNDVLGGVEIHPYYFFSFIDQWYIKRTR